MKRLALHWSSDTPLPCQAVRVAYRGPKTCPERSSVRACGYPRQGTASKHSWVASIDSLPPEVAPPSNAHDKGMALIDGHTAMTGRPLSSSQTFLFTMSKFEDHIHVGTGHRSHPDRKYRDNPKYHGVEPFFSHDHSELHCRPSSASRASYPSVSSAPLMSHKKLVAVMHTHKLIVIQCQPPLVPRICPSKAFRVVLDRDTSHQESIKTDASTSLLTRDRGRGESLFEFSNHIRRQGKAKA